MSGRESGGGSGVRVWFYGDYGCPFSYLVDRRLELLAGERSLDVRWRPLSLYPEASPRLGVGVGLGAPPGGEDADATLREELERAAADLGIPLSIPCAARDTREALEAAEFARDLGREHFSRLHRALFRALFGRGLDIGSRPVLLALAAEAGVDREGLTRALEDGRYRAELDAAKDEAARYGIEGTPGLLFGRFLIVGAAPMSELRRAADRAEREGARSR